MLLSKQTILSFVNKCGIISNFSDEYLESCTYDMRIGTIFLDGEIIKSENKQIVVQPGEIITFFTLEELNLPSNIAAFVFPRNQESSKGLLVINPGHVDPGFRGALTVKAINLIAQPDVWTFVGLSFRHLRCSS